jgi:hypothetical protein
VTGLLRQLRTACIINWRTDMSRAAKFFKSSAGEPDMIAVPFKLLIRPHTRPLLHLPETAPHVVAFRLPDGELLYSRPAASELDAIHNLFEPHLGRRLAMPHWEHMSLLANAALWLGGAFPRLIANEVELHHLLTQYKRKGGDLPEQVFHTVHQTLRSLQATAAAANEVSICLKAIDADPRAKTAAEHPLTEYAWFTALKVLQWCTTMTADALGLPGAIAKDGESFAVTFGRAFEREEDFVQWVDDHLRLWRDNRGVRLRHYLRCRDAEQGAVDGVVLH